MRRMGFDTDMSGSAPSGPHEDDAYESEPDESDAYESEPDEKRTRTKASRTKAMRGRAAAC